jgi:hypothetical protein
MAIEKMGNKEKIRPKKRAPGLSKENNAGKSEKTIFKD